MAAPSSIIDESTDTMSPILSSPSLQQLTIHSIDNPLSDAAKIRT
jgi:hypothetical protein